MKDFKEIAEKCLKGELSGYFLLRNGEKKFSDKLKKDTSEGFLDGAYYFAPIEIPKEYYNDRGNCCIALGHVTGVNLDAYNIEKFIPDFQYVRDLETSLASIDLDTFIDNKGSYFNLLRKEDDLYVFEDSCGIILYKTPYQAMKLKLIARWIMTPKEQKEVKIEIPEGYEIDKEKSTFEKIVFKKKDNRPRSWEEYCKQNEANDQYGCYVSNDSGFIEVNWSACSCHNFWKNTLPSKELAEKFLAYMQLMSLRQAWIGDWEPDFNRHGEWVIGWDFGYVLKVMQYTAVGALSFPTLEMANEFLDCFRDLLIEAKGLY